MTILNFGRDVQGFNAFAPEISSNMFSATVADGVAQGITVPSSAQNWIAFFSFAANAFIWVAVNDTAAPPVGVTFAASTSFLLGSQLLYGAQLKVKGGDTISVFNNSGTAQDVGIALYQVP